jgi:hypothetical protein
MTKLVKLTDTKGNTIYLNPDHVALVGSGISGGALVLGESAVVLINGMTLAVSDDPATTSQKLNNPDSGSVFL